MPDHIHIFIGMRPHQSISSLIQNVKTESSKWIKDQKFCTFPFAWQEGYGAFSDAESNFGHVIDYIKNQKEHHKKKTFREEYLGFLRRFNIPYEEKYLFEFYN